MGEALGKHLRNLPLAPATAESDMKFVDTSDCDESDSGLEDLWHGDIASSADK